MMQMRPARRLKWRGNSEPERRVAELLVRLDLELPKRNLILGETPRTLSVQPREI